MIAGTPDNVIPKLNKVLDVLRPGIFSFWLDGPVPGQGAAAMPGVAQPRRDSGHARAWQDARIGRPV